jgi:hypothetical protein
MGWQLVSLGPIGQEPPCRRARLMSITRNAGKIDNTRRQPITASGACRRWTGAALNFLELRHGEVRRISLPGG